MNMRSFTLVLWRHWLERVWKLVEPDDNVSFIPDRSRRRVIQDGDGEVVLSCQSGHDTSVLQMKHTERGISYSLKKVSH